MSKTLFILNDAPYGPLDPLTDWTQWADNTVVF